MVIRRDAMADMRLEIMGKRYADPVRRPIGDPAGPGPDPNAALIAAIDGLAARLDSWQPGSGGRWTSGASMPGGLSIPGAGQAVQFVNVDLTTAQALHEITVPAGFDYCSVFCDGPMAGIFIRQRDHSGDDISLGHFEGFPLLEGTNKLFVTNDVVAGRTQLVLGFSRGRPLRSGVESITGGMAAIHEDLDTTVHGDLGEVLEGLGLLDTGIQALITLTESQQPGAPASPSLSPSLLRWGVDMSDIEKWPLGPEPVWAYGEPFYDNEGNPIPSGEGLVQISAASDEVIVIWGVQITVPEANVLYLFSQTPVGMQVFNFAGPGNAVVISPTPLMRSEGPTTLELVVENAGTVTDKPYQANLLYNIEKLEAEE